MKAALRLYKSNGNAPNPQGKRGPEFCCHKIHKVAKRSFFDALAWQRDNKKAWLGFRDRDRGKVTLLTDDMEEELLHWVAACQRTSGGVSLKSTCRAGFALMAGDPEHHARVKKDHKEHAGVGTKERTACSMRWFHRLKKRHPAVIAKKKGEAHCGGRALVSRAMIDSIYDVLQTVLTEAEEPMPPENVWNFDETGTKPQCCDEFKHGLKGAKQNQTGQCGSGENVTMGLFASLTGQHVGPIFCARGRTQTWRTRAGRLWLPGCLTLHCS